MKQFYDWLYYTKSERWGILILLILLLAFTISPKLFPYFIPKEDYSEELLEQLRIYNEGQNTEVKDYEVKEVPRERKKSVEKQASKNSLLSEIQQTQNRPEVNNEIIPEEKEDLQQKQTKAEPLYIDINKATAEELTQLKGIGEVFSQRIIKYRNGLGGFVSVEQVGTTFGLEPETFQQIKPFLYVNDSFAVKKININQASAEQLQAHPYISEKLANQIVNFREKVQPYSSEADVKKLYLMNDELWLKLQPYIEY